jgi:putative Mg2+ transporter-C (MgtC) family protein
MMIIEMMDLELIGEVNIYVGVGIQVIAALFLGGLVGLDREQKSKAAGLKTNILICIGACLYTTISMIISKKSGGVVDPNRVAAQIVSGIGFLGAGAIIQGRGNVIGLTTAATIWVVAAIGYTIGAGYPVSAAFFSITVLVVLRMLKPFNSFLESEKNNKFYHLEILSHGSAKRILGEAFAKEDIEIDEIHEEDIENSKNKKILHAYFTAHPRAIERLTTILGNAIKVEKINFQKVDAPTSNLSELQDD